MINVAVSCQTLRRLGRAILTSGNARPQIAVVTRQLLGQFKWYVCDHPAYSPDLATSDFHLFFELKNWLGGQSFHKNEGVQNNVKAHLASLAALFFDEGSETWSIDMSNARIFKAIMLKNNHVCT
ncbi:hypothetical protein AVEN_76613-1 [Araneus ventricosus]|uniref:Histone-lysine N-methyltransferase SETMAR n=1 Tax=Araneus ventricosus TaxID=182803 RepID=A0A4Y2K9X7_ARAVE|nr:hypothetical protein AVEN_76613-1 [Araneus ventricosus]